MGVLLQPPRLPNQRIFLKTPGDISSAFVVTITKYFLQGVRPRSPSVIVVTKTVILSQPMMFS